MAELKREARATRAMQPGHRVVLLTGGAALFASLVECIDKARAEVLLETYIFAFEGAPLVVAEALERAARRGLDVRVVVDGIGTGEIPAEWQQRWRAAGVSWRIFNPARGWRVILPKGWRRMHRKLAVVDCRVAFCGGINLVDDYLDPSHGRLEQPRFDFAVRVTGPLVADVQETMTRLWLRMQAAREVARHDFKAARVAVQAAAKAGADAADDELASDDFRADTKAGHDGVLAGLMVRDNFRYRQRIERFYRYAIAQAQSEVLIANAYFVPGLALQRSLLRAAKRGVRITLLLQGRYEYFMQHHTSRAMYGVMLDAGIKIIEYEASFLHAKVAVFDGVHGAMSTVGSSNLDPISLLLAREANVFIRDDAFAAELRQHLVEAMQKVGVAIEPSTYGKRPLTVRSLAWLAYAMMRIALFATRHRY
ncbi:MAG: cardiolipin synthase ClsB [Pseudomonadota bacterium]|nr:cardiolipin synthase ClsB [Pseudomonadota bacterium]